MTNPHHPRSHRGPISLLLGAALTVAGALYTTIVQHTGHVSEKLYRAPLSHSVFLVLAVYAAITHLVVLTGVLALRGRPEISRAGRVTAALLCVAVGTGLLFICELLTIPLVDTAENATSSSIVDGVFGLATLLAAAGMLATGSGTSHQGLAVMARLRSAGVRDPDRVRDPT